MKARVNRTNISEHLVEYQLKMIGKTFSDVEGDEKWYTNNTMTEEQHQEFKRYAIPLLKKIFKFNKARAEETFGWFILQFGLRIKQEEL
jgi:hypothetical protein